MMHETECARHNPAPRDDRMRLTAADIAAAAALGVCILAAGPLMYVLIRVIGGVG